MGMGLKAIGHIRQRASMYLGSGHDIRAKVNQQVIVDQNRGTFSQTGAAQLAGLLAVAAMAKGFGESVGGRGSKKCNNHLLILLSMKRRY